MNQKTLDKIMSLPGWCPHSKAIRLYDLVLEKKPRVIVEIGVYGGRSLVAMAEAAQFTNSHVIGIDPYTESHSQQYNLDGSKIEHGHVNWNEIKKSAYDAILHLNDTAIIEMDNAYAFTIFPYAEINMIHIDGNHSSENVLKDLILWSHKLAKDCVVIMDDINWTTVNHAIEEYGKLTKLEDHGTWGVFKHL